MFSMMWESLCDDSSSCALVKLGISYCQEVSRRWQGRQSSERTMAVLNKTLLCLKQKTRATHHRHVTPQMRLITLVLITAGLM